MLVASLSSDAARNKSFELVAERGPAPTDLEPPFAALDADVAGKPNAVHGAANMPLNAEPTGVREDPERMSAR